MESRFVNSEDGGKALEPNNAVVDKLKKQIEESKMRQRELSSQGPQKSLYEVLQENRGK